MNFTNVFINIAHILNSHDRLTDVHFANSDIEKISRVSIRVTITFLAIWSTQLCSIIIFFFKTWRLTVSVAIMKILGNLCTISCNKEQKRQNS